VVGILRYSGKRIGFDPMPQRLLMKSEKGKTWNTREEKPWIIARWKELKMKGCSSNVQPVKLQRVMILSRGC